MEKVYNKLVRDNILKICMSKGQKPFFRILSDGEYWEYLLQKDAEETKEVRDASSIEERRKELADKLEVLIAMASFNGLSLEEIIEEADKKRATNGGFEKRILLERVLS